MSEATVTISLERYKQLEDIEKNWQDKLHKVKEDLADLKEKSNKRYEEICKDKTIIIDRGYSAFFDRYSVINPEYAADIINKKLIEQLADLKKELLNIPSKTTNRIEQAELKQEMAQQMDRSWYKKLLDLFK